MASSPSGSEYEPEQSHPLPPTKRHKVTVRKNSRSRKAVPQHTSNQPRTYRSTGPEIHPSSSDSDDEPEIPETVPAPSSSTDQPTAESLHRWFSTQEQINRFLTRFCRRTVIDPIWFNFDWFHSNGFSFVQLLVDANLTDFICTKEPFYPMLTKVFFSTLEYKDDILTAVVKNVRIKITHRLWCQLTGLKWAGEETTGNFVPATWASEYTPEEAQRAICHCNAIPKGSTLKTGNLTVTSRLLHFIVSKIVLAREGNFTTVYHDDRLCIWALLKHKPINWAYLVLQYLVRVAGSEKTPALPLPYTMIVTKILKHFNVPLEGEEVCAVDKWKFELGPRTVNKAQIKKIADEWVFSEHGSHSNMTMEDYPGHHVPPSARPSTFAGSSSSSAATTTDTAAMLQRLSLQMQTGFDDIRSQSVDQRLYIDSKLQAIRIEMQQQLNRQHEEQMELIRRQHQQQQQFITDQLQTLQSTGSFWGTDINFDSFPSPPFPTDPPQEPPQDPSH